MIGQVVVIHLNSKSCAAGFVLSHQAASVGPLRVFGSPYGRWASHNNAFHTKQLDYATMPPILVCSGHHGCFMWIPWEDFYPPLHTTHAGSGRCLFWWGPHSPGIIQAAALLSSTGPPPHPQLLAPVVFICQSGQNVLRIGCPPQIFGQ